MNRSGVLCVAAVILGAGCPAQSQSAGETTPESIPGAPASSKRVPATSILSSEVKLCSPQGRELVEDMAVDTERLEAYCRSGPEVPSPESQRLYDISAGKTDLVDLTDDVREKKARGATVRLTLANGPAERPLCTLTEIPAEMLCRHLSNAADCEKPSLFCRLPNNDNAYVVAPDRAERLELLKARKKGFSQVVVGRALGLFSSVVVVAVDVLEAPGRAGDVARGGVGPVLRRISTLPSEVKLCSPQGRGTLSAMGVISSQLEEYCSDDTDVLSPQSQLFYDIASGGHALSELVDDVNGKKAIGAKVRIALTNGLFSTPLCTISQISVETLCKRLPNAGDCGKMSLFCKLPDNESAYVVVPDRANRLELMKERKSGFVLTVSGRTLGNFGSDLVMRVDSLEVSPTANVPTGASARVPSGGLSASDTPPGASHVERVTGAFGWDLMGILPDDINCETPRPGPLSTQNVDCFVPDKGGAIRLVPRCDLKPRGGDLPEGWLIVGCIAPSSRTIVQLLVKPHIKGRPVMSVDTDKVGALVSRLSEKYGPGTQVGDNVSFGDGENFIILSAPPGRWGFVTLRYISQSGGKLALGEREALLNRATEKAKKEMSPSGL